LTDKFNERLAFNQLKVLARMFRAALNPRRGEKTRESESVFPGD